MQIHFSVLKPGFGVIATDIGILNELFSVLQTKGSAFAAEFMPLNVSFGTLQG